MKHQIVEGKLRNFSADRNSLVRRKNQLKVHCLYCNHLRSLASVGQCMHLPEFIFASTKSIRCMQASTWCKACAAWDNKISFICMEVEAMRWHCNGASSTNSFHQRNSAFLSRFVNFAFLRSLDATILWLLKLERLIENTNCQLLIALLRWWFAIGEIFEQKNVFLRDYFMPQILQPIYWSALNCLCWELGTYFIAISGFS